MEALWEQFHAAMQSYAEATEHQKTAFEGLKQKDEKSSREIEMQAKKLQKLQVVPKGRWGPQEQGHPRSRDTPSCPAHGSSASRIWWRPPRLGSRLSSGTTRSGTGARGRRRKPCSGSSRSSRTK